MTTEGEASGEEASLPKPKPNRIYNTVGFIKKEEMPQQTQEGATKTNTS